MNKVVAFRLPQGYEAGRVGAFLTGRYDFATDAPHEEDRVFLDTFDWLLYEKSLALSHAGDNLVLRSLDGGVNLQYSGIDSAPAFASELPHCPLRKRLDAIVQPRALLPLACSNVRIQTYCVLNRDEKTVARLLYTEARPVVDGSEQTATAYLTLQPVRGYSKYARQIAQELGPGQSLKSVDADIYETALAAAGHTPGSYSTKLGLHLEPEMRSDEAAKMILRRLLETMRANEAGIRNDIDIEFLHDYRVAIRRTRSALGQIQSVFPVDITEHYKQAFRELGQHTNALRDLDVYLLAEPAYRAMLPEALREDVAPLFEYLRDKRVGALVDVVSSIDSPETERMLGDWAQFLDAPAQDADSAPNAATPIGDLSRRRIYGRYRRIIKKGKRLVEAAEDEQLHDLRIDCKKLRYLLEFFASLYPPAEIDGLVRELKRLQDNLGEFNDLSVQQAYLLRVAEELSVKDPRTPKALVATGALVDALARKQEEVRSEFAARFQAFASKQNRKAYRRLFARK